MAPAIDDPIASHKELNGGTHNKSHSVRTSNTRAQGRRAILSTPAIQEDLAFNLQKESDLETAFQVANEQMYLSEKEDFNRLLDYRFTRQAKLDDYRRNSSIGSFGKQSQEHYETRSNKLKKDAAVTIGPQVANRIEAKERRAKKAQKLALQRAKRAASKATLAAKPIRIQIKKPQKVEPTPEIEDEESASRPESSEKKTGDRPMSLKNSRAVARLYRNTYESIWRDMARKDSNKTFRLAHSTLTTRQLNAKKTSLLAAREAKRWKYKTTKSIKDLQNKARRGMREMLTFWRKNEREERDLQKKAEKEALDLAKKEEEEREAQRQARKLNFLISQTELYTHFIANKISPQDNPEDNNIGDTGDKKTAKDLNFDDEDELQKAAMENAKRAFQDTQSKARSFDGDSGMKKVNLDSDDMNFQNPTSLGDILIPQPKMLRCQLKEYQIKGLSWLANLYEQGINGILADEMGLGKTVQSISVMAYLAETYGIWGPFLVVTPASTLHNWQQEIAKFVPDFKVIPYWGNAKDRKVLRKFWDYKNLKYNKESQFHVVVTSYQMVVSDANYFQKMKWQYMILDEAQAIKSSSSSRWKSLLSFHCRNRLLLTGTPIQNSMQELWALLHFIMPSLFDSHDEFSEWFSNDIESHAQSNTQLNHQQLTRLHMILKPFMLRRLKKHVQSELGDKIEEDVYCSLTNRQRMMYKTLRSQISLADIIEQASSGSDEGTKSLMNLVMQFRKVCNHPDLFERADVVSAYSFCSFGSAFGPVRDGPVIEVYSSTQNLITYSIPKLLYREGGILNVSNEYSRAGFDSKYLHGLMNIWDKENVKESSAFSWLKFIDKSASEISRAGKTGVFERAVHDFSYGEKKSSSWYTVAYDEDDDYSIPSSNLFLIGEQNDIKTKATMCSTGILNRLLNITDDFLNDGSYNSLSVSFVEPVLAPPINFFASDRSVILDQQYTLERPEIRSKLFPMTLDKEFELYSNGVHLKDFPVSNTFPWGRNGFVGFSSIRNPSMTKFITDSGKLSKLDEMLPVLKAGDHRVLIYFQMTKMMDLMEEYLTFRQYKYCRLDGSSKLSDRRDMVNDWQTKPELFVFLLSTRAGGLGINLTAADTVIFYDSDWNPTIDSQAMDRAHRMGQTRQVTVYRLLVRGTIEERMRDRAKQKMQVQKVVMEGGGKEHGVDFQKPGREVAYWLLDDDAQADAIMAQSTTKDGKKRERASENGNESQPNKKSKNLMEEMYHEGEGNFDESVSNSGTATPVNKPKKNRKKMNTEQRLKAVGGGDF